MNRLTQMYTNKLYLDFSVFITSINHRLAESRRPRRFGGLRDSAGRSNHADASRRAVPTPIPTTEQHRDRDDRRAGGDPPRRIPPETERSPAVRAVVAVTNPYHDALDDFRGEEVVAVADGDRYRGWVKVWDYGDGSLVLLDATGPDGDRLGRTRLRSPEVVYRADPEVEVRRVDPAAVEPCPYSVRECEGRHFYHYVRQVRERGGLTSYPLVHETDDGYLTLEGHRRMEAARRADLDAVPVRTTALTDWEYTLRWVEDHVPTPELNVSDDDVRTEWYTPEQVREALDLLREDWPDARLARLPQFEPFFDDPEVDA